MMVREMDMPSPVPPMDLLGGVEGLEQLVQLLLVAAGAVVLDAHHQ